MDISKFPIEIQNDLIALQNASSELDEIIKDKQQKINIEEIINVRGVQNSPNISLTPEQRKSTVKSINRGFFWFFLIIIILFIGTANKGR